MTNVPDWLGRWVGNGSVGQGLTGAGQWLGHQLTNSFIKQGQSLGTFPSQYNSMPQNSPAQISSQPSYSSPLFNGYQSQMPSIQDLMAGLQSAQDPTRYMMDPNMLGQQAASAASAQYDPVIAQLQNQMNTTSQRGERNKQIVGNMFNQLSQSDKNDIPAINQLYDQATNKSQQSTDALKQNVNQQYDQTQQDQNDVFNRLNIQAAEGDVVPKQNRAKDFFQNMASSQGQSQQDALNLLRQGSTDFAQRGSQIAQGEGTMRQADMSNQLNEQLNALQSQVGANQAAKSQAGYSGFLSLLQQARDYALQRSQSDFNNQLQSIEAGRNLSNDQFQHMLMGLGGQYGGMTVKSPAQVGVRAMSLGLPPNSAQNIQNVFMGALANNKMLQGNIDPQTGQPLSRTAQASIIRQTGAAQGLSNQELNALQVIASEYFGG